MIQYLYKIYDKTGVNFIRTLNSENIFSDIGFSHSINAGQGELTIKIKADFDNFDEGASIKFGNIVKIFQVDDIFPKGRLIYAGYISEYKPYIDGSSEGLEITLLGLGTLLSRAFYKTAEGAFQVSHSAAEVADVFKAIIDHFNTIYAGSLITYDDSIAATGNTLIYTFDKVKWADALEKTFEFVPADWFWRIDANGIITLAEKPAAATHTFTLGKDVDSINSPKSAEKIVNGFLLETGIEGSGEKYYEDAESQSEYGLFESSESDTEITDNTSADAKGVAEIGEEKDPKTAPQIVVNSNYDIFSIRPGDTCKVRNLNKNTSPLENNMLIKKVQYTPEKATITLGEFTRDFPTALKNLI